ncbi:unnamed protein product [Closterium sp. Naga37s-1]|nr:unnamed protein product [Closterium sp. Naga37s-1]
MASLLPSLIPPLFLQPQPSTPFLPLAVIRSRPDKVAPSQARHVSPNVGTPPHPPLDSRTAEAELALADVTSADMAFLRLEGVFAAFGEERVCFLPRLLFPCVPPSLAPCSPAPSPSDVSPSASLPLPVPPCIVLTQSHHVSSDPPVPRSQLPSSTVRSFHIPLRLLPPSCDLSGPPPPPATATAPSCWVGRSGRAWWDADSKGVDKEE